MPESYALTPTPASAIAAFQAGQLQVSPTAAARRTALTARATSRAAAPPEEGEALADMRLGSLIPDIQSLLERDWGDWWATMTGGLAGQVPGVDVREAVIPGAAALVPAAGAALAKWGVPAVATGAIAALGAGALGAWAGGLFGGGGQAVIPGTNIPLGGPFLAEPPAAMIAKEWNTGTAQFYQLIDGRIAVYSKKKRTWKAYRPAKHIVVSRNPRMGTLLKASRRIDKLWGGINKKAGKYMKKKVVYGILPSKALSPIEKAAIRG